MNQKQISSEEAERVLLEWARKGFRVVLSVVWGSGLFSQYFGRIDPSELPCIMHHTADASHSVILTEFNDISMGEDGNFKWVRLKNVAKGTLLSELIFLTAGTGKIDPAEIPLISQRIH